MSIEPKGSDFERDVRGFHPWEPKTGEVCEWETMGQWMPCEVIELIPVKRGGFLFRIYALTVMSTFRILNVGRDKLREKPNEPRKRKPNQPPHIRNHQ